MITREDYLNALELIDKYHQQLKAPDFVHANLSNKTEIECAIEELIELKKLRVTDVSVSVCDSEWHESNIQHFGKCNACGLNVDDF